MAGKQFELEQVLKYRLEVERMRKHEFAAAKQEMEQANEELKQQEAETEDISRQFHERHADMNSIEEIRRYSDFFARKREDIKKKQEQLEQLERIMDERREVLLDATKEKKVLESLKEKKTQQWKKEANLKEQAFMDEISIQKQGDIK
jgi:flagellar FliJ protein